MAIVIIGGLITSTALTLGVVPVVYSLLDGLRRRTSHGQAAAAAEVIHAPHPEPAQRREVA
jgi:HAE1 family hydrophobic/amphiphilic exporter-1